MRFSQCSLAPSQKSAYIIDAHDHLDCGEWAPLGPLFLFGLSSKRFMGHFVDGNG
jgi:hypothetical protein